MTIQNIEDGSACGLRINNLGEAMNCLDNYIRNTNPPDDVYDAFDMLSSAISASNSKYVPMLVEALKRIQDLKNKTHPASIQELSEAIAKQALSQLPEEYK